MFLFLRRTLVLPRCGSLGGRTKLLRAPLLLDGARHVGRALRLHVYNLDPNAFELPADL